MTIRSPRRRRALGVGLRPAHGLAGLLALAVGCAAPAALRGAPALAPSADHLDASAASAIAARRAGAATEAGGAAEPRDQDPSPRAAAAPVPAPGSAPAQASVAGPVAASPGDAAEVRPAIPGLPELALDLARLRAEYDIPVEVNDAVVRYVRRYVAPGARASFARWLERSRGLVPRIRAVLREQGLPEDLVYLAMVESGFSTRARSRARAVGTWQLIPSTARRYGLRQDRWVDERRDPEKATLAAARFLRELHDRIGDWPLAIAAYNAGPRPILRGLGRGYASFWEMARRPGVLPRETRAYVPAVLAAAIIARHPEAFGFMPGAIERDPWAECDVVTVPRATALRALARAAAVTVSDLRELNPELQGGSTPPRVYALRVPRAPASVVAARGLAGGRRAE